MSDQSLLNNRIVDDASAHDGIPGRVATAMKIDFGVQITGYLVCAAREGLGMIGIVYGDEKGRFANGHSIRTSAVLAAEVVEGYVVAQTFNSRYVVCDWASYRNGPRFTGVHH